jgi:hypothetical protein
MEAAKPYRRVASRKLSRLFVGSLGAGARPPINLDGDGGPEPEALFASLWAAIKGVLPGASVCCPALRGAQAYSLVRDCREAVIPPAFRELGEGVADETHEALHHGQYGHVMLRVNQPCGPDSKNRMPSGPDGQDWGTWALTEQPPAVPIAKRLEHQTQSMI